MSDADYTAILTAAGLSAEVAAALAEADAGLARGEFFTPSEDLVKLIGRPATTAHEAVQNAAATIRTSLHRQHHPDGGRGRRQGAWGNA